ncbi:MAG: hypothetical protein J6M25_02340 [Prevotella sp.]|nr:hypothetical protein [Prevotella sp.]
MKKPIFIYLLLLALVQTSLPTAAQTAETPQAGQAWWGYCQALPDDPNDIGLLGMETADTYDACVKLTRASAVLNGATVHGIAFMLPATEHIEHVRVWLSKKLPASADSADVQVKDVSAEALRTMSQGYIRVLLDTPYEVEDSVYAGYTFTVTQAATDAGNYPLCCYGSKTQDNAFFFHAHRSLSTWQDLSGSPYGDLLLQVLLSNPTVPQNKASLMAAESVTLAGGQEGSVPVYLTNEGLLGISSIGYSWTVDGTEGDMQTYTLPQPYTTIGGTAVVGVPLTPDADFRQHDVRLTLRQVNGSSDETAPQMTDLKIITVTEASERRILVEEFTGTWCGWCPRGMVALDYLHEHMGDQTVLIAVHGGDLMAIEQKTNNYNAVLNTVSGFPYAYLNRVLGCDPYHGTDQSYKINDNIYIDRDINRLLTYQSEAALTVAPRWNADSTVFEAQANITFRYNRDDAPYALAFVLVADDLHGNISSWNQENSYSQFAAQASYFESTPLYDIVRGGSRLAGLHYNHVAMAAWGISQGIDGSIAAPLVAGQTQTYTLSAPLPEISATLLQDKRNLSLAALLFNRETGEVVNAAIGSIAAADGQSGIGQTAAAGSQEALSVYDLQGRRLTSAGRGLHIMRMGNGETKKIYTR